MELKWRVLAVHRLSTENEFGPTNHSWVSLKVVPFILSPTFYMVSFEVLINFHKYDNQHVNVIIKPPTSFGQSLCSTDVT